MEFDLKELKEKVDSFSTTTDKITYLNRYLFELRKLIVEDEFSSKNEYELLKKHTASDYEIYMSEIYFNKRLIYWNNNSWDEVIAKKLGILNVEKLKRRLRIENELSLRNSQYTIVAEYRDSLQVPQDLKINMQQPKRKANEKRVINEFSDIFKSITEYHDIMSLLVENQYCAAGTYIWKDNFGGNRTILATIIKKLQLLNYYKITRLTAYEIVNIASNTFGVEVSISTVRHAPSDHPSISFIPISKE